MGGVRYYFDSQGVLSSKVGIDVSTYQGKIDWTAVKNAGVDFVFIRAGFRGWGSAGSLRTDAYFKQNIEGATAAGLDCGVYFFSQAINTKEAVEEAQYVLNLVKTIVSPIPLPSIPSMLAILRHVPIWPSLPDRIVPILPKPSATLSVPPVIIP